MGIGQFIVMCIYTLLPGIVANSVPVLVKKVKFLAVPVDFGLTLHDKPIFGKNKTWRGFVFGIISSMVVVYVQALLYQYPLFKSISYFNYAYLNTILLGFLIGFGVLFGDLTESFVKRRLNIKPGARFFPWDQIDSLLGAIIFISFVQILTWDIILFSIIVVPILHVSINRIAYALGLKKVKW